MIPFRRNHTKSVMQCKGGHKALFFCYRETFILPAAQAAEQCKDTRVTETLKYLRRTGAFEFIRSRSIKNYVPAAGKLLDAEFNLLKRNRYRAGYVDLIVFLP